MSSPVIRSAFGMEPADEIIPNLYQGGYPHREEDLQTHNIHVLVLCAKELQFDGKPSAEARFPFPLSIIAVPLDDDLEGPTGDEARRANEAAEHIAKAIRSGKRVLTTCVAGRNRSGLVNALALIKLGMSSDEAVRTIQSRRYNALTNPGFEKFIRSLS